MSQLSADAEGKVLLNQSMMEGSRTGKAAEADLMVLIAKNPVVDGQEEEDTQRHLNVVKNKLSGWHGVVHCDLEYKTARYHSEVDADADGHAIVQSGLTNYCTHLPQRST
jgi:hypothetical protein